MVVGDDQYWEYPSSSHQRFRSISATSRARQIRPGPPFHDGGFWNPVERVNTTWLRVEVWGDNGKGFAFGLYPGLRNRLTRVGWSKTNSPASWRALAMKLARISSLWASKAARRASPLADWRSRKTS